MLKKLLLAALLVVFGISAVNAQLTKAQIDKMSRIEYKIKMNGDAIVGVRADGKPNNFGLPSVSSYLKSVTTSPKMKPDWELNATFTPIGCSSIYDLCSNGSPVTIWQDPSTPDNIHIVVVHAPLGDGTTFPTRRSKYYFSSDRGTTWTFISDVPSNIKSGFPTINGTSDGNALIANHCQDGTSYQITNVYVDAFPGVGSFTHLYPPGANSTTTQPIWPRVITTTNVSLTNKFLVLASQNGVDSSHKIINTGMGSTPGTWGPWSYFAGDQAETYGLARGSDGRIGVVYKNNDANNPESYADVWFMESTDNGNTFTTPLKIFDCNFATDSLGPVRGVGIVYAGTLPKVVFETIKQTTEGSFYPGLPAKIRFWSPTLPGSDPSKSIVIADTTMVGYHPYVGVNDVMSSMSRPNIGVSADGNVLFAVFQVPSDYVGGVTDTTTFMDMYFTLSGNGGATWKHPMKINPETPVKDWRYPSISLWNDNTSTMYYANINVLSGNMPGSYVNGSGNGESAEPYVFVRLAIPLSSVSVNQVSNEVPSNFSLSQNYPNPFNPTTNIKFAVSKAGLVSLKVYDLSGKEITTLVNENMSVGTYEYKFNASNLSSGIYFYTLSANGFTETKKMMLIK